MSDNQAGSTRTHNEIRMAEEKVGSLLIKFSIPTIIGMLVNALYNVVDRFWVGKLGETAGQMSLAAVGLTMPITFVVFGFSMLIGVGSAANISISLGKKDRDNAEKILGNALTLILIIGVFVSIVIQILCEPLLRLIGSDEHLLTLAVPYLRIIIGGCIFQLSSFAMNNPIRAAGNTKRFASTQLLGGIANMILDPIFIFVFGLGISGAAIATVIAQILSAAWVFQYYFSGKCPLKFKAKNLRLDIATMKAIFSIGLSPFLMQIAGSVVTVVANLNLKHYGNLEYNSTSIGISAMTVINGISTMALMPLFGLNQGAQPIIGYNYGAKNLKRLKEVYKWGVIYATVFCTLYFLVCQIFSVQLVKIFNDDEMLVSIASHGLRTIAILLPVIGFQIYTSNFFVALSRAKVSILLSLSRQVIFLIPGYIILPLIFGFKGIWYAMPIADFFATLLTLFFIMLEFKRLNKLMVAPE